METIWLHCLSIVYEHKRLCTVVGTVFASVFAPLIFTGLQSYSPLLYKVCAVS